MDDVLTEDVCVANIFEFIFNRNDSLRISYIHKGKVKVGDKEVTEYYSKLMKADPSGNDQVMMG